MSFDDQVAARAARDYADFLLPVLGQETHLLDVGCGDGALSVGLGRICGRVTALDRSADDFQIAAAWARGRDDLTFIQGDATCLPFRDSTFDAVMAHSVLESGVEPAELLSEALRVLRPGGWLGGASVEYGGLILAGPEAELLRRSNWIREQLWLRSGADPFMGRALRRLLHDAGFVHVEATTKAFSYGTPERVRIFALGRASECSEPEYVTEAVEAGLSTADELAQMAAAWSRWGHSPAAYASFTWCRAVGRRPVD